MKDELTKEFKVDEDHFFCTDIRPGEYLHCKSQMFDFSGGCYAKSLAGPGMMVVGLELPEEHFAVQDALSDNPDLQWDIAEFEDIVPISDLKRPDGRPIEVWIRPISAQERLERHRARGGGRLALPELDEAIWARRDL